MFKRTSSDREHRNCTAHATAPKRAFSSLSTAWATQGAPTAIESAQNARPLLEPPLVPSVGRMDASITIHPSDHPDVNALIGQPRIMEST